MRYTLHLRARRTLRSASAAMAARSRSTCCP